MAKMMLLGKDIAHTLSPALYRAAFDAVGLDWEYEVRDVATPEEALAVITDEDWVALNVTTPYKGLALEAATKGETNAQAAGGANLLVRSDEGILAFNTDGTGCTAFLARNGLYPQKLNVAVCGTGPTARAIVYALSCAGVQRVAIFSRDKDRAIRAAQSTCGGVFAQTYEDGKPFIVTADVIIDATTLGMHEDDASPFDTALLGKSQVVLDTVYGHGESALIAAAKEKGCRTFDGTGMLVLQAAVSLQTVLTVRKDEPAMSFAAAYAAMTAALPAQ
ncbi:MAG: shikimate dehydrogenase [Eggerthellaceae bacterium]|nr:shikimate dehydrogenase [Eggerthellaceae bacterium]